MQATKGYPGFTIIAALLVTACAPLRQAPLVYTSGVTVGMNVGVSPQDGYAPSVVIGFKMLDAAYVPVAVGRNCESAVDALYAKESQQKEAHVYEQLVKLCTVQTIQGKNATNGSSSSSSPSQTQSIHEFQQHILKLQQIYAARDSLGAEITKLSGERSNNSKSLEKIQTCLAPPPAPAAVEGAAVADEQEVVTGEVEPEVAPVEAAPAAENTATEQACADSESLTKLSQDLQLRQQFIDNRLPAAEKELSGVHTNADIEQKNLANYLASADPATINVISGSTTEGEMKEDAFSVYGTFNGDAGTNVPPGRPAGNPQPAPASEGSAQASLKVGKVFSTGVASQNLTQGLKAAFVANAATSCFAEATRTRQKDLETWDKMTDGPKATAYLDSLSKAFERTLSACNNATLSLSSDVTP